MMKRQAQPNPPPGEQGFTGANLISNREKQDRKQSAPEYTCIKSKGRLVILLSNY